MKTKLITPLFLLLFIHLIFISCQEPTGIPNTGPVKPPQQIISVERAAEMYENYSSRRLPIIKNYEDSIVPDAASFKPTRYAEYDLETIKQYIAYVEFQAKQAQVDVKTLRFYLSNYPDSEKFPNGDKVRFPRKNSLFMVPTMDYKGENVGFSIEEADGKYTAVPIVKTLNADGKDQKKVQSGSSSQLNEAGLFSSSSMTIQDGTSTSLILNDGNIMPPPGKDDFSDNN